MRVKFCALQSLRPRLGVLIITFSRGKGVERKKLLKALLLLPLQGKASEGL